MCSITARPIAKDQLDDLERGSEFRRGKLTRRIVQMAEEASIDLPGLFDNPSGTLRGMPGDLRGIRHYRLFGRHRVYVTGSHSQCCYELVLVKGFKKSDVLGESEAKFQNLLRKAIGQNDQLTLLPPERKPE